MKREEYSLLENYMLRCMGDSAHDREHVYRVLHIALQIAETEEKVDTDVLIAACLLHDIGRQAQAKNPKLCHAQVGAKRAARFLKKQRFPEEFSNRVCSCILTHRFRKENPPGSLEAQILFDADKLDVTGAVGIARTLLYQGEAVRPLYTRDGNGNINDGTEDPEDSFFREYKFKLEKIYSRFYTRKGREMAMARQEAAARFYRDLLEEVRTDFAHADNLEALLEG